MSLTEVEPEPHSSVEPLSEAGRGAIAALVRVVELYEPAVAHRSALRAVVAAHIARELGITADETEIAVATSAMADVDLTISRPAPEEARRDVSRSVLAATLVDRVPGLHAVAEALRHQTENWDGSGGPDGLAAADIPLAGRIAAVTDQVVGNPAVGYLPTWPLSMSRAERRAGMHLDPSVIAALRRVDVDSIQLPVVPSAAVSGLLSRTEPATPTREATAAATDVAIAVAAAARVEDLLQLFADIALRSIDAANVSVLRLTRTSIEDSPLAEANDGREPIVTPERLAHLTEFSTVAELRAGESISRTAGDPSTGTRLRSLGIGSEIAVPIMLEGDAWGIVTAARRTNAADLDEHDLSVLRHIAHQASIALANTVRWEKIEDMALRDQLTGLANRHVLYAVLDEIFQREAVDRQDCAVVMCDVDGLKNVNDTEGHEAGDRLLIDAALALRNAIRDPDRTTICRIGGDEFCLVIDGGALLTAHEISDTIERLFERSGGPGANRSISCGLAFASSDIETRSQLLRAADENQYETKRARRASRGEPPDHARTRGDRRAIRD